MGKAVSDVGDFLGDVVTTLGDMFGLALPPKLPDTPYNKNLLTNDNAPTSHIGVVYGTRRKAGVRIGTYVMGSERKQLYAIYALSHGPVKSIANPRIDDVPFSDWEIKNLTDWSYGLGSLTQDASQDRLIQELGPNNWDEINGKLQGVAFAVIKLTLDEDHMTSFGNVTFDIQGRLVFDPRTGLTKWSDNPALCSLDYQQDKIYGKGISYPAGFSVASYIDAANYFDEQVISVDPITGSCGLSDESRPDGFLVVSETLFNTLVAGEEYALTGFSDTAHNFSGILVAKEKSKPPYIGTGKPDPTNDPTGEFEDSQYKLYFAELIDSPIPEVFNVQLTFTSFVRRYTCNGNVDTSQTVYDNLMALNTAFNGYVTFFSGMSHILPDRPEPVTATFDSSNITSGISVKLPDSTTQLNEITGTWFDPEFGYDQMTETVKSSAYLSRDKGRIQPKEINMPFSNNPNTVRRILSIELNKSRHSGVIEFTTLWEGLSVVSGNVIEVVDEDLGWIPSRKFRVVRIGIPDVYNDISLTCVPYDGDDYIEGVINPRTPRDYVSFPRNGDVNVPTNFVAKRALGLSASTVTLSWTPVPTEPYKNFDLEVYSKVGSVYTLVATHAGIYSTSYAISDTLVEGDEYEFRLYVRTTAGFRSNTYAYTSYTHERAITPTGITLSVVSPWAIAGKPTYASGFEAQLKLRHKWFIAEHTGTEPSFASATLVGTSRELYWGGAKPEKTYRVWCKAVTDFDESDRAPAINGVGVTMPTTSNEDLGDIGSALSLRLTSDAQIFSEDDSQVVTPAAINFTAVQQNSSNTITWETTPTVTLTGTGKTRALSKAAFGTNQSVKVTITADGLSDTITINRVTDGSEGDSALSGYLTNESHVIPANSAGTVTGNWGNAGGIFKVFLGTIDVTTDCTFAKTASSNLTAAINSSNGGYTLTAMSADSGTTTFTATYNGSVITKVYTLSKSKSGATGVGVAGARGSQDFYRDVSGATSPDDKAWSTVQANLAITSAGLTKAVRDTVTLYNETAGSEFAEKRFWDGAVWAELGQIIDTNLFVNGTIGAEKLAVTSLSAITATMGTLNAGEITGTSFTGGLIQTATSGARVVLTNSNTPIQIYGSDGVPAMSFDATTGSPYFSGGIGNGAIRSTDVFTTEVLEALMPKPVDATGGNVRLAGVPIAVPTTVTKVISLGVADDEVSISLSFKDRETYEGTTQTTFVASKYRVSLRRQKNSEPWAAVTGYDLAQGAKVYTGTTDTDVDPVAVGGNPYYYATCDLSINETIIDSAASHGAVSGDTLNYELTITYISGNQNGPKLNSYSLTQVVRGGSSASTPHTHPWDEISSRPTNLAGYGITDALKTADISAWAKASTKPSYSVGEISSAVSKDLSIGTGTGLSGGGTLWANRTISLGNSAAPITAYELASSDDLNDLLSSTDAGFYYQNSNSETPNNNYPSGLAGSLLVQKSPSGATQMYQTYHPTVPEMYFRTQYSSSISPWRKVLHSGNFAEYAAHKDYTVGDFTIGNNSNGKLFARHIDGKDYDSNAADILYLNHSNGKNVYINDNLAYHAGNLASQSLTWTTVQAFRTASQYPIAIEKSVHGGGVGIQFTDNTSDSQHGHLTYFHSDAQSYGSANAFVYSGDQPSMSHVFDTGTNENGLQVFTGVAGSEVAYDVYHAGNIPTWNQDTTGSAARLGGVGASLYARRDTANTWTTVQAFNAGANIATGQTYPFRLMRGSNKTGQDDNITMWVDDSNLYFVHNNDDDSDASTYRFQYTTGGVATDHTIMDKFQLHHSTLIQAPTIRVSNDTDTYMNTTGIYDDGNRVYSGINKPTLATLGVLDDTHTWTAQQTFTSTIRHLGSGVTTTIGALNGNWCHFATDSTNGFYFYENMQVNGSITATSFVGTVSNADKLDNLNSTDFIRSTADSSVVAHTKWQDNKEIRLGSGDDLRLFHDGASSIIRNYTGPLYIQAETSGGEIYLQSKNNSGANRTALAVISDSNVYTQLRYNSDTKLQTNAGGVSITGTLSVTDSTKVANLNADQVDGWEAIELAKVGYAQTFTGTQTFNSAIRANSTVHLLDGKYLATAEVRSLGTQLVLNGGDSAGKVSGQTSEIVYVNAEGGLRVSSSSNNWQSGGTIWRADICDSGGNSTFPNIVQAPTIRVSNDTDTYMSSAGIYDDGNRVYSAGNFGKTQIDALGINATELDGHTSTDFIQQASYTSNATRSSGYYKIKIVPPESWMLSFTIRVYQDYRSYDINVSGYNYGANHWYKPKADLMASSEDSIQVKFGYDSAWNLWVAIPAGNYTGISIVNVVSGYNLQETNWRDNLVITYQASLTGTTQTTLTANRPLKYNENAVSATKLATARTISLTGDVSGSTTFDGTANKSISVIVNNNSHTHDDSTITGTESNSPSTVAQRNSSGDLIMRLPRVEYELDGWNGSHVLGINVKGGVNTDNYGRPSPSHKITPYLTAASASAVGIVNTGTQTFAGTKTFSDIRLTNLVRLPTASYITDEEGLQKIYFYNTTAGTTKSSTYIRGGQTGTSASHRAITFGNGDNGYLGSFATNGDFTISGALSGVSTLNLAGNIVHTGDTDTYIGFHALNQWRVVVGGTQTLEVRAGRVDVDVASLAIDAGKVMYFDGGSDTYIQENTANNLRIVAGGTERFNVNSSGIQVIGSVYGTSHRVTSAERYKNISKIVTPSESLDKICELGNLGVKIGTWKDQDKDTDTHRWLIAEEVEEIFPELITYVEEDGEQKCDSVNQTEIIADLCAAVYALKQEIEDLKRGN